MLLFIGFLCLPLMIYTKNKGKLSVIIVPENDPLTVYSVFLS